jgi:hypothetical protein
MTDTARVPRQARWRCAESPVVVTASRPEPDLNPYGPDLQEPSRTQLRLRTSSNISAGQVMIILCPRTEAYQLHTLAVSR